MLITQKQLEQLAYDAGYDDYWEGYAMDKDLSMCEICEKWGNPEEVYQNGYDVYCGKHRPEGEIA